MNFQALTLRYKPRIKPIRAGGMRAWNCEGYLGHTPSQAFKMWHHAANPRGLRLGPPPVRPFRNEWVNA